MYLFCVPHPSPPAPLPLRLSLPCEGSGAHVLWGAAVGAGGLSLEERRLKEWPYCSLQLPERRLWPGGGRSLLPGNQRQERGPQGRVRLSTRRDLFSKRVIRYWNGLLRRWWITVPGGSTQWHGPVDKVMFGQRLDSMISEVFSNLIDSVSPDPAGEEFMSGCKVAELWLGWCKNY